MRLEKIIIWDDYLNHFLHLDFARRKHSREIKNETLVREYDGFVIEGSKNFIEQTMLALEKLKDAPEEYKIIQKNIQNQHMKEHY